MKTFVIEYFVKGTDFKCIKKIKAKTKHKVKEIAKHSSIRVPIMEQYLRKTKNTILYNDILFNIL
jgi:hypothetical protein